MADGQPIIQGILGAANNQTQTPTDLTNQAAAGPGPNGTGLFLFSGASGMGLYVVARGTYNNPGVQSFSYGGDGVNAYALGLGAPDPVTGVPPDSAGVRGTSLSPNGYGVEGQGFYGMLGQSSADFGTGVEGDAFGNNAVGVHGAASGGSGSAGVYAYAPGVDSAALQVNGRAVFSSSGTIVIPARAISAAQSGLSLSTAAFVLATLQQNLPQVSVRAAVPDPAAGTVTIYLTAPPPVDVTVGWMVVN
jgi:hypothetical protein